MDLEAPDLRKNLQRLLEEALGCRFPQMGTHKFNQVLVKLRRKKSEIMAALLKALQDTGRPSGGLSPGSSKALPPWEGKGRGDRGGHSATLPLSGEKSSQVNQVHNKMQVSSAQPPAQSREEVPCSPPKELGVGPPPGKRALKGEKSCAYQAFRKKVERRQQTEREFQCLLKVFEPNPCTAFFGFSFSSSPAMLLLNPAAGYLLYRISLGLGRNFPVTPLGYYRNWLAGSQVYVIPDDWSGKGEDTA